MKFNAINESEFELFIVFGRPNKHLFVTLIMFFLLYIFFHESFLAVFTISSASTLQRPQFRRLLSE